MRIGASTTAITWLPFDALDRPPPEVVLDLDELRRRDAFREANELRAWIEVEGGQIADYDLSSSRRAGRGGSRGCGDEGQVLGDA